MEAFSRYPTPRLSGLSILLLCYVLLRATFQPWIECHIIFLSRELATKTSRCSVNRYFLSKTDGAPDLFFLERSPRRGPIQVVSKFADMYVNRTFVIG